MRDGCILPTSSPEQRRSGWTEAGDGAGVSPLPPPAAVHSHTQLTPVESWRCVFVWRKHIRLMCDHSGTDETSSDKLCRVLKYPWHYLLPSLSHLQENGFCSLIRLSCRFHCKLLMLLCLERCCVRGTVAAAMPTWDLYFALSQVCAWIFHNCSLRVFVGFVSNRSLNGISNSLLFILTSFHLCQNISWCSEG